MTITQLQIRDQQLDKDIDRLNKETPEPSGSSISPVLLGIFRDKEAERNQKRQDLLTNIKKINDILDDLAKNVCGKLT